MSMEEDIANLTSDDLRLLIDTFQVVRTGDYPGSEVQMGFRMIFAEADTNQDGFVDKQDFYQLMAGYFNSKHMKPS